MKNENSFYQKTTLTSHQDIIHDLALDWFGTRLATASSDNHVKVFHKQDDTWQQQSSIKVKGGPVWKVRWARPQFGKLLGTASLKKNLCIFELKKKWCEVYSTMLMQGIEDLKFIPYKSIGLVLAVATSDGFIKLYQATDITQLNNWRLDKTIPVNPEGINSFSWNKNSFQMSMAVGCKDSSNSKTRFSKHIKSSAIDQPVIQDQPKKKTLQFVLITDKPMQSQLAIEQYSNIKDVSWAWMNGRSFHLIAYAGSGGVFVLSLVFKESSIQIKQKFQICKESGLKVSWNVMCNNLAVSLIHRRILVFARLGQKWSLLKQISEQK